MQYALHTILFLLAKLSFGEAGICWRRRHSDKSCSGVLKVVSQQKDCCSSGGVAFSSGATSTRIFFYMFVERPPCNLCKDACSNIKCDKGWQCKITSRGVPGCKCQPDCSKFGKRPVCGSDGQTYPTECHLLKKTCLKKKLVVEYHGKCKRYCHGVQCSGTQVCIADKSGNSYCIDTRCPTVCPRSKYPVCGTDRKTYGTECALKKASCVSGRKINLAYLGLCQTSPTCHQVRCPHRKTCVLDVNKQPRCVHCGCTLSQEGLPVCGSDGKKYRTWCHMRKSSCQTGQLIRVNASEACK